MTGAGRNSPRLERLTAEIWLLRDRRNQARSLADFAEITTQLDEVYAEHGAARREELATTHAEAPNHDGSLAILPRRPWPLLLGEGGTVCGSMTD